MLHADGEEAKELLRFNEVKAERDNLREALAAMCQQFAGWDDNTGGLTTDCSWALRYAFSALEWSDPMPMESMQCDEPGCLLQITCGWPSAEGYRRTCSTHYKRKEERKK